MQELMNKYGFTQTELADRLGMRQSQISNYLNGKSKPNYDTIREMSRVFSISADELCGLLTCAKSL